MPFTLQKRRYTHDWLLIANGYCQLNVTISENDNYSNKTLLFIYRFHFWFIFHVHNKFAYFKRCKLKE